MIFGVNFADGRIKGYGLTMPGGGEKTFFVQCVRATLITAPTRSPTTATAHQRCRHGLVLVGRGQRSGMDWRHALAWVQQRNKENYLGHSDWRLPDAKELQSIVDYGRSPNTTASAAIDPAFSCTSITNEAGQADYPYYWTGTTTRRPTAQAPRRSTSRSAGPWGS